MNSDTTTYLSGRVRGITDLYVYAIITSPSGNVYYTALSHQISNFYGSNATRAQYVFDLKSVSSASSGVDPFTRDYSDSDCELEILDIGATDGFRKFASDNRMLNSTVQVRWSLSQTNLGSTSDTASVPYWKGLIADVIPKPGMFLVRCESNMVLATRKQSAKHYFNKHPLELISSLLTDAGVPSANIDSTSLAFNYSTDISHFCVSTQVFTTGESPMTTAVNVGGSGGNGYIDSGTPVTQLQ